MLFGDSITQQSFAEGGWGARLADAYARKVRRCGERGGEERERKKKKTRKRGRKKNKPDFKTKLKNPKPFLSRSYLSPSPSPPKADVVLRGFSGYNTEWALPLIPEVFYADGGAPTPPAAANDDDDGDENGDDENENDDDNKRPNALVTIFFGANDAALPNRSAARQHVPLARFKRNLEKMTRAALESVEDGGLVVLISCPPVDDAERSEHLLLSATGATAAVAGRFPPPERTNEAARDYSRAAREVAEAFAGGEGGGEEGRHRRGRRAGLPPPKVAFLDLWSELEGQDRDMETVGRGGRGRNRCLSDGLHLSPLGNAEVFRSLMRTVEEGGNCCGHLLAERLPFDYPLHSEMEPCPR